MRLRDEHGKDEQGKFGELGIFFNFYNFKNMDIKEGKFVI